MDINERNLLLRVIRYSINKDYITKGELYRDLKVNEIDRVYIENYFVADNPGNITPNSILGEVDRHNIRTHLDYKYRLLPSAIFQYVDYIEIKDARKHSKLAFGISIIAIAISLIQIYFGR